VALLALGESPGRLLPVLHLALERGAAVVLVAETIPTDMPTDVEIQPTTAMAEVAGWADYLGIDLERDSLPALRRLLAAGGQAGSAPAGQVLVAVDMPCGGLAECGVCAVRARRGWKLACVDGPVFELSELF